MAALVALIGSCAAGPPVPTCRVMGDGRYEHVVALRAVETVDFMTAHFGAPALRAPGCGLAPHRQRGAGIARVAYDASGKPPVTIEWE